MINDILHKEIIERMNEYRPIVNYNTLGTEILLLTLMDIEDSMTNLILNQLNVSSSDVLKIINDSYFIRNDLSYTYTLQQVFKKVEEMQKNKEFVYDEAYLYAILEVNNCVALNILSSLQIEGKQILDELVNALSYLEEDDKMLINLTKKAKNNELNKLIGRNDIINTIDNILSKKQKNNCMLIGPAGVGKSGIVEGLTKYYLKKNKEYLVYQLDLGSLIAGTRYRGDLEEKVMDLIDRIKDKNIILFIDEIHNIVNSNNSENSIDIANLLKPFLARGTIRCIGATTIDEYYKTIAKDKALTRRFKNIYVNETNIKETITILKGIRKDYEQYYKIRYSDDIVNKVVISSMYFPTLYNPDKSIDIFDECGVLTKKSNLKNVNINILKKVVYNTLGINIKKSIYYLNNSKLDIEIKKQIKRYLNLQINKTICTIKIKNEMEKEEILYDLKKIFNLNNENILELDCNDYINEHTISSLLGTSPGYIGYEDSGILSKQILRHNINIIVFINYNDNNILFKKKIIDKIINQGYIIDYQGNKLNFLNTILIFINEKEKRIGLI